MFSFNTARGRQTTPQYQTTPQATAMRQPQQLPQQQQQQQGVYQSPARQPQPQSQPHTVPGGRNFPVPQIVPQTTQSPGHPHQTTTGVVSPQYANRGYRHHLPPPSPQPLQPRDDGSHGVPSPLNNSVIEAAVGDFIHGPSSSRMESPPHPNYPHYAHPPPPPQPHVMMTGPPSPSTADRTAAGASVPPTPQPVTPPRHGGTHTATQQHFGQPHGHHQQKAVAARQQQQAQAAPMTDVPEGTRDRAPERERDYYGIRHQTRPSTSPSADANRANAGKAVQFAAGTKDVTRDVAAHTPSPSPSKHRNPSIDKHAKEEDEGPSSSPSAPAPSSSRSKRESVDETHQERRSERLGSKTATVVREKIGLVLRDPGHLKRVASQVFRRFDEDGDQLLTFDDVKSMMKALSEELTFPMPDDSALEHTFDKFANDGTMRIRKGDFGEYYRMTLCWIRDTHFHQAMRMRRDFFIMTHQQTLESVYVREEKLGQGQFGVVYKVRDRFTNVARCCKTISKGRSTVPAEFIQNEIRILKALDHPNIVKLYECFEDDQNLYLIFELIEGAELLQVLLRRGKEQLTMSEPEAARLVKTILGVICHCHAHRVMHKDLKPENIMLIGGEKGVKSGALKIIDFGLAEMFKPGTTSTTAAGTPYYMAPEVFYHKFNYKCDVWSVGILTYLMLTAHLPFDAGSKEEYIKVVNNNPVSFPSDLFKNVSREAKDFIKRLLEKDHKKRPTAQEALKDKWLLSFQETIPAVTPKSERSRSPARQEREGSCSGPSTTAPPSQTLVHRDGVKRPPALKTDARPSGEREESPKSPLRHLTKQGSKFLKFARQNSFQRICLNLIAMNLSYASVAKAPAVFRELDKDHDGLLSEDDLSEGLKELGVPPEDVPRIVDALDCDDSGLISYTEFVASLIDVHKDDFDRHLMSVFRNFDVNGDGRITRDELARLLTSGGLRVEQSRQRGKELEQVMSELDRDGDGIITFEEFRAYMRATPRDSPASWTQTQRV
uniref:non-specific serine/threonine protein kinase n=1 Tax=Chromera velia CCMP2878 TaxID=1169474 RepID=A0A0G4GRZ0_9ALVE|eukprot:Cvel_23050.t1-p1 / transcript=Cvel_23050.t1 / gene=Cvel_23050 / organism=Chromera_velia_CCMP2878 / gene_product=Calcium-dependent protein kinase 34, putative / transcript_product=Calcium-dependent protein kinase 34, putative / location=Cvel_scaffold2332:13244-19395(-) / protein_length=1001 / sequence_SO=supercontig / SO=protein_coding / is_pseudo=false